MTDKKDATPAEPIDAEGWRPNPGDVLSGKVTEVSRAWSDFTDAFYPLITIHDDTRDEDVAVHAFHHTLQSRLMELRPVIGSKIEISYHGKRETKDGKREVAIYKVTVPGETGAATWDALGAQPAQAAKAAAQGEIPVDDEDIPF